MQKDLFGNPVCSKGWDVRCRLSHARRCRCACGGKNHGLLATKKTEKPKQLKMRRLRREINRVADEILK